MAADPAPWHDVFHEMGHRTPPCQQLRAASVGPASGVSLFRGGGWQLAGPLLRCGILTGHT
jgi:hypothetical protein